MCWSGSSQITTPKWNSFVIGEFFYLNEIQGTSVSSISIRLTRFFEYGVFEPGGLICSVLKVPFRAGQAFHEESWKFGRQFSKLLLWSLMCSNEICRITVIFICGLLAGNLHDIWYSIPHQTPQCEYFIHSFQWWTSILVVKFLQKNVHGIYIRQLVLRILLSEGTPTPQQDISRSMKGSVDGQYFMFFHYRWSTGLCGGQSSQFSVFKILVLLFWALL